MQILEFLHKWDNYSTVSKCWTQNSSGIFSSTTKTPPPLSTYNHPRSGLALPMEIGLQVRNEAQQKRSWCWLGWEGETCVQEA